MTDIVPIEPTVDLSIYQNDPELLPVVEKARDEFYHMKKIFPRIKQDAFLAAYLAGYVAGVHQGINALKEINTK